MADPERFYFRTVGAIWRKRADPQLVKILTLTEGQTNGKEENGCQATSQEEKAQKRTTKQRREEVPKDN